MKISQLIVFALMSVANQVYAINYAWWVTYQKEPESKQFQNIGAEDLNPEFDKILVLSCEQPSSFSKEQCDEIEKNNLQLIAEGDFNNDGVIEIWRTGVAKSKQGKYFKMLFATSKSGALLHSIGVEYDKPGFSVFMVRDNSLSWAMCMECGDLASVVWDKDSFVLDWGEDYE